MPGLRVLGFFVDQRHLHAGHQHRLAAQQVGELAQGQGGRIKILGVRPGAHRGALLAVALALGGNHQRLDHIAATKGQFGHLTLAVASHLQPGRQRVGHAHTHAVQAAREAVGPALALVELAAGVQAGEHQFHHRRFFFRVHAKRNAAPVVVHTDRTIGVHRHFDLFAKAGQGLVGCVV